MIHSAIYEWLLFPFISSGPASLRGQSRHQSLHHRQDADHCRLCSIMITGIQHKHVSTYTIGPEAHSKHAFCSLFILVHPLLQRLPFIPGLLGGTTHCIHQSERHLRPNDFPCSTQLQHLPTPACRFRILPSTVSHVSAVRRTSEEEACHAPPPSHSFALNPQITTSPSAHPARPSSQSTPSPSPSQPQPHPYPLP